MTDILDEAAAIVQRVQQTDDVRARLRARAALDPPRLHGADLTLAAAWYAWTLSQSERDQRIIAGQAASMLGMPGHTSVLAGILERWRAALGRLRGAS